MERAIEPTFPSATDHPVLADGLPSAAQDDPGELAWARSAPWPDGVPFSAPHYRGSPAWLALLGLAIGGSALYLGYAVVVAPAVPARPAEPLPPIDWVADTAPAIVAPPQPAARRDAPDQASPPAAQSLPADTAPVDAGKPARIHRVASRPARHRRHETQHSFGWHLVHPLSWLH